MWTVYAYANCSSCRRALQLLEAAGQPHQVQPIREKPPSRKELARALQAVEGDVRRLFNTSGADYREQKIGELLNQLTAGEALALLASKGSLVKRPFVVTESFVLVGFDEPTWRSRLGSKAKAKAKTKTVKKEKKEKKEKSNRRGSAARSRGRGKRVRA